MSNTQNEGRENVNSAQNGNAKEAPEKVHHDKAKPKPTSTLPLFALNHISFLVKDLNKSARFYQKVMGFVIIKRPDVFSFQGSWMFGHGVSIHLLGADGKEDDNKYKCGNGGREILEFDNHISFQCSNLYSMMRTLETSGIKDIRKYDTKIGGKTVVDRITFHDPDGNMIEITNSQNLPIVPSASWPPKSMPTPNLEFTTPTRAKEMTCRPKSNRCTCNDEQAEEVHDNTARQHHLLAMNHVGLLCESLEKSLKFYTDVLEFVSIELPNDENLHARKRAWLFGHGIGIHLTQGDKHDACPEIGRPIDPQDNHISFQCTNMYSILRRVEEFKEKGEFFQEKEYFVPMDIKEDGVIVNQIFFHDPDGNMIEFCNCQELPVVPVSACPPKKMPTPNLDFSSKELACKPRWPSCKRNKVEEDEEEEHYDFCNKRRKPKGIRCACFRCEEMMTGDTAPDQELKSCTSQDWCL